MFQHGSKVGPDASRIAFEFYQRRRTLVVRRAARVNTLEGEEVLSFCYRFMATVLLVVERHAKGRLLADAVGVDVNGWRGAWAVLQRYRFRGIMAAAESSFARSLMASKTAPFWRRESW